MAKKANSFLEPYDTSKGAQIEQLPSDYWKDESSRRLMHPMSEPYKPTKEELREMDLNAQTRQVPMPAPARQVKPESPMREIKGDRSPDTLPKRVNSKKIW